MNVLLATPPRPLGGTLRPPLPFSPMGADLLLQTTPRKLQVNRNTVTIEDVLDDDVLVLDSSPPLYTDINHPDWSLGEALRAANKSPTFNRLLEAMGNVVGVKYEKVPPHVPQSCWEEPLPSSTLQGYAGYLTDRADVAVTATLQVEDRDSGLSVTELQSGSSSSSSEDIMQNGISIDWPALSKSGEVPSTTHADTIRANTGSAMGSQTYDPKTFGYEDAVKNSLDEVNRCLIEGRNMRRNVELSRSSQSSGYHSMRDSNLNWSRGEEDELCVDERIIKKGHANQSTWSSRSGRQPKEKKKKKLSKKEQKRLLLEDGRSFVNGRDGGNSKKSHKSSGGVVGSEGYSLENDDATYYSYDFIFREGIRRSKEAQYRNSEKPYPCPVPSCDKTYKNANGLKYHAQYGHSPKQEFVCEICSKKYGTKHGLNAHKKAHVKKLGEFACESVAA